MTEKAEISTLTRRSPALHFLLEPTLDLARAPHWEGELTGTQGAPKGCVMRLEAQIDFNRHSIEGVGRAVNFPSDVPSSHAELTLSGSCSLETVMFEIWFSGTPYGHQPFCGAGTLGNDGREMSGDWSVACLTPDSCGCNGGGGTFRLKRID